MSDTLDYVTADLGQVVSVGGARYAAGLVWELNTQTEGVSKLAKAGAEDRNADLFCITRTQRSFGYGNTADGLKRGMASLAGTFKNSIEHETDSVIGLFELDNGLFYFIAIRQDSILARSDKVFARLDEAVALFETVYRDGQWDIIYAPAEHEIGLEAYDTTPIVDLLAATEQVKLQPVSVLSDYLRYAGLIVIALIMVGIGDKVWNVHQQHVADEKAAQLAALQAQIAQRNAANRPPPAPPYQNAPAFVELVNACVGTMSDKFVEAPGWKMTSLTCGPNSNFSDPVEGNVGATFKRAGGTITWINAAYPSTNVKWDNGNGASITWPVAGVSRIPKGVIADQSLSLMTVWVASRLDEIFVKYSIKPGDQPPANTTNIPPANGKAVPIPFWPSVAVEVVSTAPPSEIAALLAHEKTMTLRNLSYDPGQGLWTIDAQMYGPKTTIYERVSQ